jgi:hypothetical protein
VDTGFAVISVFQRVAGARIEAPAPRSVLTITDLRDNSTTEQRMPATTTLELKPSKYSFVATIGQAKSQPVEIGLKAGASVPVKLVVEG